MPKVNPDILRWARETAGLSIEEACYKLSIQEAGGKSPVERLYSLETGENEPSRLVLHNMAKQYRRPLVVFYAEKPPQVEDRGQDFRILPDGYTKITNGMVDALIRDVQVRQRLIRTTIEDDDEVKPLPFVGSVKNTDPVNIVVQTMRSTSNVDLKKFYDQPSSENAFKHLRKKIEEIGVFVLLIGDLGSHHSTFDLEVFRGFALSDEIAPFIVINDKDSKTAWSFTLIHELTHIWLGQSGISNANSDLEIEQFCNKVASEFLLPEDELNSFTFNDKTDLDDRKKSISQFAHSRNLSSSMVAYKLFLLGKIDRPTWIQLNAEYKKLWLEAREEKRKIKREREGGPSYYKIRRHRLGENLISLVHQMILGGALTTVKASKILGVSPKNVQKLIEPKVRAR